MVANKNLDMIGDDLVAMVIENKWRRFGRSALLWCIGGTVLLAVLLTAVVSVHGSRQWSAGGRDALEAVTAVVAALFLAMAFYDYVAWLLVVIGRARAASVTAAEVPGVYPIPGEDIPDSEKVGFMSGITATFKRLSMDIKQGRKSLDKEVTTNPGGGTTAALQAAREAHESRLNQVAQSSLFGPGGGKKSIETVARGHSVEKTNAVNSGHGGAAANSGHSGVGGHPPVPTPRQSVARAMSRGRSQRLPGQTSASFTQESSHAGNAPGVSGIHVSTSGAPENRLPALGLPSTPRNRVLSDGAEGLDKAQPRMSRLRGGKGDIVSGAGGGAQGGSVKGGAEGAGKEGPEAQRYSEAGGKVGAAGQDGEGFLSPALSNIGAANRTRRARSNPEIAEAAAGPAQPVQMQIDEEPPAAGRVSPGALLKAHTHVLSTGEPGAHLAWVGCLALTLAHYGIYVSAYDGSPTPSSSVAEWDDIVLGIAALLGWLSVLLMLRPLSPRLSGAVWLVELAIPRLLTFAGTFLLLNAAFACAIFAIHSGTHSRLYPAATGSSAHPKAFASLPETMATLFGVALLDGHYDAVAREVTAPRSSFAIVLYILYAVIAVGECYLSNLVIAGERRPFRPASLCRLLSRQIDSL